jgi:transposase
VDSGKLGRKENKMPKTRPPYPPEFREQILELVRAGRTPSELAREFEPSRETIRVWVKQAELDAGERQDGLTSDEKAELARLRKENKRLRQEREILKKAAAWFAQETAAVPPKSSGS